MWSFDFLDPNEIADVDTGDEFLCEFRREWMVWRESGVKGFHHGVVEVGEVAER
jgi:hypothetical protein